MPPLIKNKPLFKKKLNTRVKDNGNNNCEDNRRMMPLGRYTKWLKNTNKPMTKIDAFA